MCNRISSAFLVVAVCFSTWEISGMDHNQIVVHKKDADNVVSSSMLNMYENHIKILYFALRQEARLFCKSLQKVSLKPIENSSDRILSLYKKPERFNYMDNWNVESDEPTQERNGLLRPGDIQHIREDEPWSMDPYFGLIILSSLLTLTYFISS